MPRTASSRASGDKHRQPRNHSGVVRRAATLASRSVYCYGVLVALLWASLTFPSDRVWPVTLFAFGPRWIVAAPWLPLAAIAVLFRRRVAAYRLFAVLALAAAIIVIGILDFRVGTGRASGPTLLRIMTQNVGNSRVSAGALNEFMRVHTVDVAALQECPFYDLAPATLGWHFFYGGDLCLVSRFPFTVLDTADPDNLWQHPGREPQRFLIDTPVARVQLLNVHLITVREALEAIVRRPQAGFAALDSYRGAAMRESAAARERIRTRPEPAIVVGDFNLPVDSTVYRTYWGDMANAFSICGRGFGHTKLTSAFGIRIDHVLTSAPLACTNAQVLTSPYGGDHRPLIVDLLVDDVE
jgi:vancomycin resistance protein VanJ